MTTLLQKITAPKVRIEVDIEGKNVTVKQISVRHLDEFIELIEIIGPSIQATDKDAPPEEIISKHSCELCRLVAICSDRPEEFFLELSADQLNALLIAVIEANLTFFLKVVTKASGTTTAE